MVSDWQEIVLDDVLSISTKKVDAKDLSLDSYISTDNMLPDFGGVSKADKLPSVSKVTAYEAEDILFSNIRTYFKKIWFADKVGGCSNDVIVFRSKKGIYPKFAFYTLMSESFIQHTVQTSKGTKMPRGDKAAMKLYSFLLPTLSEQKAIAHILETLDDKIELNRQMNETLEAMAQALFKSWFVDFDPVIDNALLAGNDIPDELAARAELRQAQIDSGKSTTNSQINDLFPSEFEFTEELGWIPKGWKVNSLEDLANISSSKRIFAKEYLTEGVPFYRGKEISLLSKSEDVSSEIYISQERFMELKDKFGVPKEGDILLTSVGTLGNAYLVNSEDEFYFKDGNLTWFKDYKTLIKGEYLYYWLKSREAKLAIDNITIGSTQQALTISSLNGIKIVKPNDSAIKIFNESIIPIIVKSVHLKKNRVTLAKLRDTLLPKLMSGELRIADAKKLVEDI